MSEKFTVRNLIEMLAKQNWDASVSAVSDQPSNKRKKHKITGIASNSKTVEILIEEGE